MKAKKQLKKAEKRYKALAEQYYKQQAEIILLKSENEQLNKLIKQQTVLN